jgi:hypothetical protein
MHAKGEFPLDQLLGKIAPAGWGTFSGSGAGASLKTGTPSISLVLY